jgi:hypothetical protein
MKSLDNIYPLFCFSSETSYIYAAVYAVRVEIAEKSMQITQSPKV